MQQVKTQIKSIDSGCHVSGFDDLIYSVNPFVTEELKSHFIRTGMLCYEICKELGLGGKDTQNIVSAGFLHDIGKLHIPDEVLNKSQSLNNQEWEIVKKHPKTGADILSKIPCYQHLSGYVLHHHERWDGLGYPEKLKGEQIPVESAIIAVSDAYDAMTHKRAYRNSNSHEYALCQLKAGSGTQFSPKVVQAAIQVVNRLFKEEECS